MSHAISFSSGLSFSPGIFLVGNYALWGLTLVLFLWSNTLLASTSNLLFGGAVSMLAGVPYQWSENIHFFLLLTSKRQRNSLFLVFTPVQYDASHLFSSSQPQESVIEKALKYAPYLSILFQTCSTTVPPWYCIELIPSLVTQPRSSEIWTETCCIVPQRSDLLQKHLGISSLEVTALWEGTYLNRNIFKYSLEINKKYFCFTLVVCCYFLIYFINIYAAWKCPTLIWK